MTEELLNEYRKVAYYYYKVGLTQDEIAKKMKMSRQRVNRIVSACLKMGIVKISIEGLDQCNLELETALEQKYQLAEVRIVESEDEEALIRSLGKEAGKCLKEIVSAGDIIGVSRGRTTSAMVEEMTPIASVPENVTVTQLLGSTREPETQMDVDKIVYRLAEKLNAKEAVLHAPVITKTEEIKSFFIEDPYCRETYEIMRNCTIAVVGVGTAQSQWKHMVSLYDSLEAEQTAWAKEVAGEVCTHFYDRNGNNVEAPFRNRIISIGLEDYKKIPFRLGVAGGAEKAEAIRAALKGGYINALITDVKTAELLKEG